MYVLYVWCVEGKREKGGTLGREKEVTKREEEKREKKEREESERRRRRAGMESPHPPPPKSLRSLTFVLVLIFS